MIRFRSDWGEWGHSDEERKAGDYMARIRNDIKPEWAKKIEHLMVDRCLRKSELAKILNVNYSYLCNVMNGYTVEPAGRVKDAILAFFGISESEE